MSPDDLTYKECCEIVEQIAEFAPLILVLGGGEPLWRRDVFEIANLAVSKNIRVTLATNGTLVDEAMAQRIEDAGILRVAISLDGADRITHDTFRGESGAFDAAITGIKHLNDLGISTQINTSVARHNVHQLPDILRLAQLLGVDAFHVFLLVPTGCGLSVPEEQSVRGVEYEAILNWLYARSLDSGLELKAACAPPYYRVARQRRAEVRRRGQPVPELASQGVHFATRGCPAGSDICFISHQGEVFPCGQLPVPAGDLRKESFHEMWRNAEVFQKLRDPDQLEGKCGLCEFKQVCLGCRAKAFGITGNYLAGEPFCIYKPRASVQ
jgi:radical SAM protein with 4Fe4S-binding SPASM domain